MQLQTYFFCDCELVAGWVPRACFLVIQPKQVMAQRRDSWQERKREESTDVCTEEHEVDHHVFNRVFCFQSLASECDLNRALKPLIEKVNNRLILKIISFRPDWLNIYSKAVVFGCQYYF